MAITATTFGAAVGVKDTNVTVASATGITAPNFTSGTGITYLQADAELMLVLGVSGTVVSVQRGYNGSLAAAHSNGGNVMIGAPADFAPQVEYLASSTTTAQTEISLNWPATFLSGSADALTGTPGFFVVKTAGVDAITLATPTAAQEGNVIFIWSDTANAHTVTCPTTNFAVGAAANKTVCTFPARPGAGIQLRVCNLNYHLISTSGTGTNAGVVVWT